MWYQIQFDIWLSDILVAEEAEHELYIYTYIVNHSSEFSSFSSKNASEFFSMMLL